MYGATLAVQEEVEILGQPVVEVDGRERRPAAEDHLGGQTGARNRVEGRELPVEQLRRRLLRSRFQAAAGCGLQDQGRQQPAYRLGRELAELVPEPAIEDRLEHRRQALRLVVQVDIAGPVAGHGDQAPPMARRRKARALRQRRRTVDSEIPMASATSASVQPA